MIRARTLCSFEILRAVTCSPTRSSCKSSLSLGGPHCWIAPPAQYRSQSREKFTTRCRRSFSTSTTQCSLSQQQQQQQDKDSNKAKAKPSAGPHDIGGQVDAYGPVSFHPHDDGSNKNNDLLEWEQKCHAMFALLASKGIVSTDELRRSMEGGLTAEQVQTWTYYEKWTAAMVSLLVEKSIVTSTELQDALWGGIITEPVSNTNSSSSPKFAVGDTVRVKRYDHRSGIEWRRPHIRTPGYIYGCIGQIERVCGKHGDPSYLAFLGQTATNTAKAPMVQLYRVRFRQADLWPEYQNDHHDTNSIEDVVEVEVYEHWLEPAAAAAASHDSTTNTTENIPLFRHSSTSTSTEEMHHSHDHSHDHHHDHHNNNNNNANDDTHESRAALEMRAAFTEGPPRPGQELFRALHSIVVQQKELLTTNELRSMMERMDTAGKRLDGATLVLQAWLDDDEGSGSFRQRLLQDAPRAAAELGISTSNPNAPTVLTVVPNTETTHNVIVCTLCSCYPSALLGIAPRWYKSREYRARAVREPRTLLHQDFGLTIPPEQHIRVHDSTADHRYLVLPQRPAGTEGWSPEQLRRLITRDTMIGVAIPTVSSSTTTTKF